jgi:hypothetical protein
MKDDDTSGVDSTSTTKSDVILNKNEPASSSSLPSHQRSQEKTDSHVSTLSDDVGSGGATSPSLSSSSSDMTDPITDPPPAVRYYHYTEKAIVDTTTNLSHRYHHLMAQAVLVAANVKERVMSSNVAATITSHLPSQQLSSLSLPPELKQLQQEMIDTVASKATAMIPESWKNTALLPSSFSSSISSSLASVSSSSDTLLIPTWAQGIIVGAVFVLIAQWTLSRIFRNKNDDSTNDPDLKRRKNTGSDKRQLSNRSVRRSSFALRPKNRGVLLHHSGGQLNFEASGKLNAEEGVIAGSGGNNASGSTKALLGSGTSRDRVPSDHLGVSMEILGGRRGRFNTFDFFGMNQEQNQHRFQQHQHVPGGRGGDTTGAMIPSSSMHSSASTARHRANSSGDGRGGVGSGERSRSNSKSYHRERLGSMDLYYGPGRGRRGTGGGSGGGAGRRRNSFHDTPLSQDSGGFNLSSEPSLNSPSVYEDINGGFTTMAGEQCLYDEFGIVTLSHRVEYFGPEKVSIDFRTMTPPTSWQDASRRIIPSSIMAKLHRRLKIDCSTDQLDVAEPSSGGKYDFSLPMSSISINVHRPLEGAVISVYVRGTPKEEWMEHTFESAHAAAQFQLDLLAYQTIGTTLKHIFEALNMIYLGSSCYDGQEFVLHDDVREDDDDTSVPRWSKASAGCIAWDDAMRAMSSIPTIRIALERLWLTHRHPNSITPFLGKKKGKSKSPVSAAAAVAAIDTAEEIKETNLGIITEEYAGKRLLLGPVDFFRLFIPALPETALPEGESNRARMEQLLSWRKRAARAAVLVRAYTRAKRVNNLGWKLSCSDKSKDDEGSALVQRLAYDGNEDNNIRDAVAKNEIYEASVSRDVLCYVRPFDFLSEDDDHHTHYNFDRALVLSPFQGYSHVDTKYFKVSPDLIQEGGPMHIDRDPIDIFPSLREMIVSNPDLDFIIYAITQPYLNVLITHVFVRSLAKCVDPQFDTVVRIFRMETFCVDIFSSLFF